MNFKLRKLLLAVLLAGQAKPGVSIRDQENEDEMHWSKIVKKEVQDPETPAPVDFNRRQHFALSSVTVNDEGKIIDGDIFLELGRPAVAGSLFVIVSLCLLGMTGLCGYKYAKRVYQPKEEQEEEDSDDDDADEDDDAKIVLKAMAQSDNWYTKLRYRTYLLFEEPGSSSAAQFMGYLMLGLVLGSCVIILVSSLPSVNPEFNPENKAIFDTIDQIMTIGFTIEWVCRAWATPILFNFMTDALNICDLLTVLPVWIEAFSGANTINVQFLRAMRLMKIFRFFKMVRVNKDLQIIALTIEKSCRYLSLLAWGLSIAAFMMACGMFTFEGGVWDAKKGCSVREDGECSPFESVPMAIYFAVTTMTTVGYGDSIPITPIGKIIAMMGQVVGVFVVALPVTVLGADFMDTYTEVKSGRSIFKERKSNKDSLYEHFDEVQDDLADFMAKIKAHIDQRTTGISETVFLMSLSSIERNITAQLADAKEVLTESDREAHSQRKVQRANRLIEEAAQILQESPDKEPTDL